MGQRFAKLLWVVVAVCGGCSGKLFFTSPCANVSCPTGTVCDAGQCVATGAASCTPVAQNGACPAAQVCVAGACFSAERLPAVCASGVDGTCQNGGSCQAGNCVPIASAQACSLDVPEGLCAGGQTCVFGYCYADDGNVLCSAANAQGACALGQTCVAGQCQTFTGTCGPQNLDGSCGTWQVCSEGSGASLGVCVGPFPPDGCSATTPAGRCPADEVCVAGTCTPVGVANVCSALNVTGLCTAGAACTSGGFCVATDPNVACSPAFLTGPCDGGGVCRNGTCQTPTCSDAGGHACPSGQWCVGGVCAPLPCDTVHPDGACADSTLACVNGICAPPTCSAAHPYGVCAAGLRCFAGTCLLPPCASDSPHGPCPDLVNQVCDAGVCVVGPCSGTRPEGTCSTTVCTDDPSYGCVLTMPSTCCDDALQAASGCTFGTCSVPLCSAKNPNGYCSEGEICRGGGCVQAACGPFFLTGHCTDPNASCIQGRCTRSGCTAHGTTQAEQDAYCAPDVCDSNRTGNCVAPACALAHPTGTCPAGQACCNAAAQDPNDLTNYDANCSQIGTCDAPTCSRRYPGGSCAAGLVCAGGTCVAPPCSLSYPHGTCGPNTTCNAGVCVLQACSPSAPGGTCPSGKRCVAGSCVAYTCSSTFPLAPCSNGNMICQAGTCVTPTCSKAYPGGACPAPKICQAGGCIVPPCSSAVPTGVCPAHETCCNAADANALVACARSLYGTCVENNCSVLDPAGACTVAGQVCVTAGGTTGCQPYACSAIFPQGPCAQPGTTCINGACQQPNCDAGHPGGKCPGSQLCDAGTCVAPACSSQNPNGACPASQFCDPNAHRCTRSACSPSAPAGSCPSGQTCCNSSVAGAPGCATQASYGTCVTTVCSAEFPYGRCPNANTICVNSQCVQPCGTHAPLGWCPGGFACVERACAAACPDDQDCDTISDEDEGLANLVDTDGDGVPDAFDHDSDGDTIPDAVEAGDRLLSTRPVDTDGDGIANFRSQDSDGDFLPDSFEVGPAPSLPRDTDHDGRPDYVDTDSDNDGILDRCEALDVSGRGICGNRTLLTNPGAQVLDSDGDGVPDYRDTDSDGDGVPDAIEARAKPSDPSTLNPLGIDHDGDGVPDYRDTDSDGDGVADADEDKNGDGIVNCHVDGAGTAVPDSRPQPACGQTTAPFSSSMPYDYNPGCQALGQAQKCLLAETDRIVVDTDGNGIPDGQDGIFMVCSAKNLKPINLFYAQAADYAFALETNYEAVRTMTAGGVPVGLAFDDPNAARGSYAVSGMLLHRTPNPNVMALSGGDAAALSIQKALAQAAVDEASVAAAAGVSAIALVINRNTTSFDGYAVVISRYTVTLTQAMATAAARDMLMSALDPALDGFHQVSTGPVASDFTLTTQTLYRWDNGSRGTVMLAASLAPTGTDQNAANTYSYRTQCPAHASTQTCAARVGCAWNAHTASCAQTDYQLPLFYADNITNGSALTQYGDDVEAICQSLVQNNALVDFLWTVDNSTSMTPKIGRVANAASLFFPLLNTTEADYRISQTTTSASSSRFAPLYRTGASGCTAQDGNQTKCQALGCAYAAANPTGSRCVWGGCGNSPTAGVCANNGCIWANGACRLSGNYDRLDGAISHDFTGAVAGITDLAATDRSISYSCEETCTSPSGTSSTACGYSSYQSASACPTSLGCAWNGSACVMNCCPACLTDAQATPNDPACYFAARLPNDTGSGSEYGLLMTEWALFRAGVQPGCAAQATQPGCLDISGCIWSSGTCSQGYCAWSVTPNDPNHQGDQAQCNGYPSLALPPNPPLTPPYPGQDLMPANCEWDAQAVSGQGACVPSIGPTRCASYSASNTAYGTAAVAQAACQAAAPQCVWTGIVCEPTPMAAQVLCEASSSVACLARGQGLCQWDTCSYADQAHCDAVFGCTWNGATCLAVANGGACRPPLKRMMRANATPVSLIVSDEDECYVKDGPGSNQGSNAAYDGSCNGGYFSGGLQLYTDPVRLARVASYGAFINARGLLTFALTGDRAQAGLPPPGAATSTNAYGGKPTSLTNGGCANLAATPVAYYAEPGQAYINVAEGTGGGWGSICASNLYPSIEAMVTSSLGRASPYKLSGYIDGHSVQPIASTIEVATQTCVNPTEYPSCRSGTFVQVVPRSRDNGWDYDSVNNTLVLYGQARPVTAGSITVSYRYWVNLEESPQGTAGGCPCPQTNLPSCACPLGQVCGTQGEVNTCAQVTSAISCAQTPGCAWNQANSGFCETNGLCEPNPTCGGSCATGLVCDPALGLCVCDPSCGGVCTAGTTCDDNVSVHDCQQVTTQAACAAVTGCGWNAAASQCVSNTCGTCICDTGCGGGCPAGGRCNSNPNSATCGQCACDTGCGGGCANGGICNSNPNSPTCGLCEPPQCGNCPSGFTCNQALQVCTCDQTCGGSACAAGAICDSNSRSATCGQCVCDTTCGGGCPPGQSCNADAASGTCGFCQLDASCGGCNPACTASTAAACGALSGCRWAPWLASGAGACVPQSCRTCDSSTGLCHADTTCCNACGPHEICNGTTGTCVCDTTCGGCPAGQVCNTNTADVAGCGACQCDPTCGASCPADEICDGNPSSPTCGFCRPDPTCGVGGMCNPACAATTSDACAALSGCQWETWADGGAGACGPIACQICNQASGVCTTDTSCCGACGPGQTCNPTTGACACDTGCGGGCTAAGTICDRSPSSGTCGQCVCDPTCGGTCPTGEICNTNLQSATCGECIIDTTCGGRCAYPLVCNPAIGLCGPDPHCGGCAGSYVCDVATGECVPPGG